MGRRHQRATLDAHTQCWPPSPIPETSMAFVTLLIPTTRSSSTHLPNAITTATLTHIRPSGRTSIALPSWLTAIPTPFPRPRSTILWLRYGFLRLADNPAVNACANSPDAVLPVVTILRHSLDEAVICALTDLSNRFRAAGSILIVRLADNFNDEVRAIHQLLEQIRARRLVLNFSPNLEPNQLQILRQVAKVDVWNGDTVCVASPSMKLYNQRPASLTNAPLFIPNPPCVAFTLPSHILHPSTVLQGETPAREKLSCLLRTSITLPHLYAHLVEEIRLGCLAKIRIQFEFYRVQQKQSPFWSNSPFSALKAFFRQHSNIPVMSALSITAYDVNGSDRRGVEWDDETNAFVLKEWEHQEVERRMKPKERAKEFIRRRKLFLSRAFFPDDVTPDYYSFTLWRFAQRCVSATVGVFGTSSLLFALGIRSGRIGQAAVISWVLKDGLGRVGKMLWAGSMGRDFDVDPKRWRFRSALLYALGNGLEIVTQIFPASFLLFATAANAMKQISMLTSSATRNAMYRSFGGRSQNIANITAKGEAQIVVADLIGMTCGIRLSKFVSASPGNVLGVYAVLTVLDIFGIYMELRQVVFRTVNAERASFLIDHYLKTGNILTPSHASPKERIFLIPSYTRHIRLSSIAKAARDPQELELLLKVFRKEHFMVATPRSPAGGPCRLVLRKDSSNEDVLRAMLMIGYLQQAVKKRKDKNIAPSPEEQELLLRHTWKISKRNFPSFFAGVSQAGWNTDNLLFSTLKRRGFW